MRSGCRGSRATTRGRAARSPTGRAADGDRIILFGAGAIGTFILAGLVSLADADITVVDFAGERLDRALRLGATRAVPVDAGVTSALRDVVGPRGADVVIEATGAPGQLAVALGLVRPGGTILGVGLPSAHQDLDVHRLVLSEVTISTTVAHICGEDLAPALDILATTDLGDELVEAVYGLDAVPDQLARLAAGQIRGKVLFDPTRTSIRPELRKWPRAMRAAVFHDAKDIRVEDVAEPTSVGPSGGAAAARSGAASAEPTCTSTRSGRSSSRRRRTG